MHALSLPEPGDRRRGAARPGWIRALLLLLAAIVATPALACEVPTSTAVTVGSVSPAALKAGAVGYTPTGAGFSCASLNVLTLLSGNFLSARIPAGTVLKLTSTTNAADTLTYQLFANASSSYELKAGTTTYYMNGAALNLLNLNGNGGLNVQMFFRFPSGTTVAPGTYTGIVPIRWDWNFCNGVAVLGACVGVTDAGTATATVTITLVVAAKPPTVDLALGPVTWDPVSGTNRPKATPGSKRRLVLTLSNPDLVATELNAIAVVVPTASRLAIALDGDGTGSGAVIQSSEGSVPSGATITYASPGSTADQVAFSNDGGTSWGYVPVAGNAASQAAVTALRFTPQGTMAPQSSISVSIPYSVK